MSDFIDSGWEQDRADYEESWPADPQYTPEQVDYLEWCQWAESAEAQNGADDCQPEDFDLCPNGMHVIGTCSCRGDETLEQLEVPF
jgi:hypothetical protein